MFTAGNQGPDRRARDPSPGGSARGPARRRSGAKELKQAVRVVLVRLHARPEAQRCSGTSGRAQSSAAPLRGTRWCGEGHPG